MNFDKVIMNPPYKKLFHLKIFDETYKHLNKNGCCVNLSPSTWLAKHTNNRPISKYRKIFNGRIKDIEIIDHTIANSLFGTGNSIEVLGIYVAKNDESSTIDLLNYGFENEVEKKLYDKINVMNPSDGIITFSKCRCNDKYGSGAGIRKPYDVVIYGWHGGKNCREAVVRENDKKVSAVLYFNSENERKNFLNSLDTTFMNWYYQMFVVPGDYKIINYMFRMVDYSQPWTDERFYKYFNITLEEQKIIEETMKKYK